MCKNRGQALAPGIREKRWLIRRLSGEWPRGYRCRWRCSGYLPHLRVSGVDPLIPFGRAHYTALATVKISGSNLASGSKYDLDEPHQRYSDEKRDEVDNVDSEILMLPDLGNQIGGTNVKEVTGCERDKK